MNSEQNNAFCKKCKTDFIFLPHEAFWDDHGYGYSTKLVKCPYCGQVTVVKHQIDRSLNMNNDKRYYKY